jgi:hypothetical protein
MSFYRTYSLNNKSRRREADFRGCNKVGARCRITGSSGSSIAMRIRTASLRRGQAVLQETPTDNASLEELDERVHKARIELLLARKGIAYLE